jgi:hypothetical protein
MEEPGKKQQFPENSEILYFNSLLKNSPEK